MGDAPSLQKYVKLITTTPFRPGEARAVKSLISCTFVVAGVLSAAMSAQGQSPPKVWSNAVAPTASLPMPAESSYLADPASMYQTGSAYMPGAAESGTSLGTPAPTTWIDSAVNTVSNDSWTSYYRDDEDDDDEDDEHDDSLAPGACCCSTCCIPFWQHRTRVFGEFLYLDAKGADLAYALPRDGVDPATSVPFGSVGVANPDYSSGFRTGVGVALDRCSSIVATYQLFESDTYDQINVNAPLVIHSLMTHPGTASAASDSLVADASYDIDFDLIDLDYRRLLRGSNYHAWNYTIGLRYGHLDQDLLATQPISPGTTSVLTNVNFEGLGARIGLDYERKHRCRGWLVYGRGFASLLAGDIDASYQQSNTFALTQATTDWDDDRVVPVLEYELGFGWQNRKGTFRATAGYTMAAWSNMVTTGEWVQAVQRNDYVDLGDTITFDGLTARIELRR